MSRIGPAATTAAPADRGAHELERENEHIRADPHYTQADGASEFMSHHQARARQIEENIKIIVSCHRHLDAFFSISLFFPIFPLRFSPFPPRFLPACQ